MSSVARQRKMADRIKVIVAECLEKRVKDPRLGFTTITDVRVTTDLREASVFYTVYGDDQARTETAAALTQLRFPKPIVSSPCPDCQKWLPSHRRTVACSATLATLGRCSFR